MLDRDYQMALDYHRRLIEQSKTVWLLDSLEPCRPTLKDRIFLRLGDILIVLGRKFRQASGLQGEAYPVNEISLPALARDCQ